MHRIHQLPADCTPQQTTSTTVVTQSRCSFHLCKREVCRLAAAAATAAATCQVKAPPQPNHAYSTHLCCCRPTQATAVGGEMHICYACYALLRCKLPNAMFAAHQPRHQACCVTSATMLLPLLYMLARRGIAGYPAARRCTASLRHSCSSCAGAAQGTDLKLLLLPCAAAGASCCAAGC